MARREFLHKRTNNRIDKPLTAVKITKVPDEVSERASNQSLDIVRHAMLVCVEKGIFDDFKTESYYLNHFRIPNVALKLCCTNQNVSMCREYNMLTLKTKRAVVCLRYTRNIRV